MPSPDPASQPEEMNSSQLSNASSSVPNVPSSPSAPIPTSAIPSVSVKIPKFFNLSSTPATLSLSGSLINGHPFSGHDGDKDLVIYSGNAAECPRAFIIFLDEEKEMDEEEQEGGEEQGEKVEEEAQPAELPVEAPVELKSGWPVELRDSEDTESSQPQTNNAELPSTAPNSHSTGAPPFIPPIIFLYEEPNPSKPPIHPINIHKRLPDLNTTPVGLWLGGNAMNGYPFSGRWPNEVIELWSGPAADCHRSFNITLHLNYDDPNPEDFDCDDFWDIDESDDGKRMQNIVIRSVRPVWPWEPLTPIQSSTGSPVGSRSDSPVGSSSDHPDGFGASPLVSFPGGPRDDSPVSRWPRPRGRSI
ncbi:hypothetical protein N0V85_004061 [Neurospora sp. IMI 360204]|nr:hypothetical protein N0V85_004061 [Neurospora sp. IMI 360204]